MISPGRANIGIIPPLAFKRGRVGTVSRSGSITYYLADTLSRTGYGETTCVGLGGDPVLGSTFNDVLALFEKDPETKAVCLAGEIGGVYEEIAAQTISKMSKPVIAIIGGVFAPPGKRMGHAGRDCRRRNGHGAVEAEGARSRRRAHREDLQGHSRDPRAARRLSVKPVPPAKKSLGQCFLVERGYALADCRRAGHSKPARRCSRSARDAVC